MTAAPETVRKSQLPWGKIAWFGLLMIGVLRAGLEGHGRAMGDPIRIWATASSSPSSPRLSSGRSGTNCWQPSNPNRTGGGWPWLLLARSQLIVGVLGVELFLSRTSFVIVLIGAVWLLGGDLILKKLAFPLFLLFFMVPIDAVIYNQITFPLQLLASRLADGALTLIAIPVLREGNILELPNQRLSVVEACSGIRSLLSLTFLSLVYGYFFERKTWIRVVLFLSTIPIAIVANSSRVTITGVLTQVKPDAAEGFFHEAEGWVIFMVAFAILILFHQLIARSSNYLEARRKP
jgi:exosortase